MAEDNDPSRTEPASSRRLQEARQAGDVPRSAELGAWVVLLAALGVLTWQASPLLQALQHLAAEALRTAAAPMSSPVLEAAQAAVWPLGLVLLATFVAGLAAPLLLSGWVYAPAAARADFTRAHPLKPLTRLLSPDAWFDGGLALLKLALVGVVAIAVLSAPAEWQGLGATAPVQWLGELAAWLQRALLTLLAAYALAVALHAGWRWWRYLRRHAMTWQEVLAEAREAEVHPEVRAQVRGRQQQAAQERNAFAEAPPRSGVGRGGARTIDEVVG